MKNKALILTLASALLVTSGCAVIRDLVKKATDAGTDVAIGLPENAITNSYSTAKGVIKGGQ